MKPSPKKMTLLAAVIVVAIIAATKGYHWYQHDRFIETTDNAYIKADSVALRPELAGRISAVAVHENQRVSRGQLLLQIDPDDYQARLSEAQAQLAVAQAALADVREQTTLQHKTIDETTANIEAAEAELERTRLDLERSETLAKQEYGSKQQLQNNQAAETVAKARLSQAQAAHAAGQQMLAVLAAKRQSANAQITSAQSAVRFAKHQLQKTTIVAPRDGIIGNLGARVGNTAQPQQVLLYLIPLPDVYVLANYKETQIGHMSIGQAATFTVDALPEQTFNGVVDSIAPAAGSEFSLLPRDNATGNFNKIVQRVPVRIRVTGPADQMALLRPGLSVVPAVDTQSFQQQDSYLVSEKTATTL
ncbi:HlyD family secretion protein [uncultured Gilvimarinus sp.]|uniref:HlyD family secretion protein n=1 Tax=uncultured Gilvimarinus sp. TaxID=1689143 RepID=UPI0030D79676